MGKNLLGLSWAVNQMFILTGGRSLVGRTLDCTVGTESRQVLPSGTGRRRLGVLHCVVCTENCIFLRQIFEQLLSHGSGLEPYHPQL